MKHTMQGQTVRNWGKATAIPVALLLTLFTLAACVFPIQAPTPEPAAASTTADAPAALDPQQAYAAALQDAKVAEPEEVFDGLTAIIADNTALTWPPETERVLVSTWTSWNGYDTQVGKAIPLTREIWVTAVPQL